jgi:lipopolysaccharide heptosyltransferase I
VVNILIVKPSSFGDVIHTFPALEQIRRCFPDAAISWVVNREYAELVEQSALVDEVIVFDRNRWRNWRCWHEMVGFVRDLRRRNFDLVFDFQGLLRSGLIAWLSGGRRRVGFANAREGATIFYSEKVALPVNLKHAVDKNLFLVQSSLSVADEVTFPELESRPDCLKRARQICREYGIVAEGGILAVAPSTRWESKRWPPEFFAAVMDAVVQTCPGVSCWLLGTAGERALGEAVVSACQQAQPVNLMGKTNSGILTEMLRMSSALLCNDSGPMHLAAALRVPTVALFGPTDPDLTGPYGPGHRVFRGKCDLAPCFLRDCPKHARICVSSISATEVAADVVSKIEADSKVEASAGNGEAGG